MSMLDRLASKLYGGNRLEVSASLASVATDTYTAIATSDSADGAVSIVISDDVTQPDEWQDGDLTEADLGTSIEVPTTVAVKEGDRVLVTASGAETINTMVVTGVVGRGDEQQGQIDAATIAADDAFDAAANAEALAQQAEEVAQATGQYFWHNTGEEADPIEADVSGGTGAHVTQFKREEWSDPTHENYHKGPNSLWNSLGMLFRNGLNNLMALLAGRTGATITFTGAQSELGYGRYAMPPSTRAISGVLVDGVATTDFSLQRYGVYAELELSAPQSTATVEVTYDTDSAVSFFFNNKTTAAISPYGMALSSDYADGEFRSASLDFFNHRASVYATADTEDSSDESQGISISAGDSGDASASVSVDSGDSGASVTLITNHQDQRYFYPQLTLSSVGTTNIASLKSNTVRLDYGDANPHGGPFDFDMLEVINSIRTASTTMQLTNVGSGTHTLNLYRQGHFVYASMANAINPSSANTAINAGTIPSGYRPAYTAFCSGAGMVSNTISNWFYRWRVATTGAITLHISVTGAREAPISMCWFTNDAWPS